MKEFTFYQQLNVMDCGPTCLRMIAKYHGKNINNIRLREATGYSKEGVTLLGISNSAETIGFRTRGVRISIDDLLDNAPLPCILHWNQNHFVVLLPLESKKPGKIKIADPANGIYSLSKEELGKNWLSSQDEEGMKTGVALLIEPTAKFYEEPDDESGKLEWSRIIFYLRNSRSQIVQVFIALLITSAFQIVTPFLTQSMVDNGINTRNLNYISIVLIAQLMLAFSRTIVDFIRTQILLYISVKLNFSLLSDFWTKLTRLPMSYFDKYQTGDTLQRLEDSKKIETFLTSSTLNTFFSMFNFGVFAIVLVGYNLLIFLIFVIGSVSYFIWVRFFLKYRRKINYKSFNIHSKENSLSLQMIQGMQELKLNSGEKLKRWEWENMQSSLVKIQFLNLSYSQIQQAGALLINEGKNIAITFIAAKMVLEGHFTFGEMLAVQYIIGQLNSPVGQFIGFMQNAQDAKISLERLNEIHELKEEEQINDGAEGGRGGIKSIPDNSSILLKQLSFTYPGADRPVLQDINLKIPFGKTTAIVGVSGSGKTTLLKLLLKFYEQYRGDIFISGNLEIDQGIQFKYISPSFWRMQCGAVLQDGFIFNDSIARNIAVGDEHPDLDKLIAAARVANILPFIEELANGFYTKIGTNGVGISQGQKQRLLIARAVYKDPSFLFLDEATNSLDSNNEKVIIENLQKFLFGKTVLVVAHRLSTVKNADKIIVLHDGMIAEEGTHLELTLLKGRYYNLVKNQLELGS